MNACRECGEHSYNNIVLITETRFGHGDATHVCSVVCQTCGNSSVEFPGYGLFSEENLRKAQHDWNHKN